VKRILQNPQYCGALTYNKRQGVNRTSRPRPADEHIIVDGVFPAIISREQFEEVQELIKSQARVAPASKSSGYLLTGLVYCEHCGGRMHGYVGQSARGNRIYRYYRCSSHTAKGSAVCKGNSIGMDALEGIVVGELKRLGLSSNLLMERAGEQSRRFHEEVVPLKNKESALAGRLKELEQRSMHLIELYEQSLITKDEFVARRKSLDSERAAAEQELANVQTELAANELSRYDVDAILYALRNLGEVYEHLEFAERRELLRSILSSVIVGKHSITYNIFSLPGLIVDSDRMDRGSWLPPA
jgi:site-specific DNA recombinase